MNTREDLQNRSLQDTPDSVLEHLGIIEGKRDFSLAMREHIWGTYGELGDKPLEHKKLCDCSTLHLENIIATQSQLGELTKRIILALLRDRYQNDSSVIESEEADDILALGREFPLTSEDKLRLLTTVVKTMQESAKLRGDQQLFDSLAGEPSEVAADIIANSKRNDTNG